MPFWLFERGGITGWKDAKGSEDIDKVDARLSESSDTWRKLLEIEGFASAVKRWWFGNDMLDWYGITLGKRASEADQGHFEKCCRELNQSIP